MRMLAFEVQNDFDKTRYDIHVRYALLTNSLDTESASIRPLGPPPPPRCLQMASPYLRSNIVLPACLLVIHDGQKICPFQSTGNGYGGYRSLFTKKCTHTKKNLKMTLVCLKGKVTFMRLSDVRGPSLSFYFTHSL